jgi:uncharacterized protein DUF998
VTFNVAWVASGLAQPSAYSVANDDISDLGAMTATIPWIYNQVGANLTGILVVLLGLGLLRALSPDVIGRIGAAVLIAEGISTFFDGIFHLDCQGIDAACDNISWHSRAHKIESGFTAAFLLLASLILAFAFRRNRAWRDSWIPSVSLCLPSSLRTSRFRPSVTVLQRARAPWSSLLGSPSSACTCSRRARPGRQRCPETGARCDVARLETEAFEN